MPTRSQSPLLRALNAQLPEMVSTLRRYVEQESPSGSPDAIASLVSLIASDFAPLSPRIRQHHLRGHGPAYLGPALFGPTLQIDFTGPRRSPRLLLLGHTDTVYPLGHVINYALART